MSLGFPEHVTKFVSAYAKAINTTRSRGGNYLSHRLRGHPAHSVVLRPLPRCLRHVFGPVPFSGSFTFLMKRTYESAAETRTMTATTDSHNTGLLHTAPGSGSYGT